MKILCILILLFFHSHVFAAILVEEKGRPVNPSYENRSINGFSLRHNRKMGVGLNVAGALGMGGVNLEINFTPKFSFVGGFGLGKGYQSYHLQVKRVFGGRSFLPYLSMGFTRWYSTGTLRKQERVTPGFFSEFLNDTEKRTGKFGENMIYPGLGLQFIQLHGEWEGFSIYIEAIVLMDIDDLISKPTSGLGVLYYF